MMEENDQNVIKFMEFTGSSREIAINYVINAKQQLSAAVNAFFEHYAPISTVNSEDIDDFLPNTAVGSLNRAKKRTSDTKLESLLVSSDTEDSEEVVFVSEHKAKGPKLALQDFPTMPIYTTNGHGSTSGYSSRSSSRSPPKQVKRKILIDGPNVAVTFAKSQYGPNYVYAKNTHEAFSVEGLETCINYFKRQGFEVRAFVPEYRLRHDKSSNCPLINRLKEEGTLIPTPAKSYDDGILLESAIRLNAAVVSNDFFRE